MNTILLYGSCYGTARAYAQELSRRTGIEARPCGTPADRRSPDAAAILKSYGSSLDLVDFSVLDPVEALLRA